MEQTFTTFKNYLSKFLLGLTFLWSVFLFSGYVNTEFLNLPSTTETELVEANTAFTSTISFQKANATPASFSFFYNNPLYFKSALLAYNSQVSVAFQSLQEKCYHYLPTIVHLPIRTIPQSINEASSCLL